METILWLVGALVVLAVAGPVIRILIAAVLGRSIGALALAQQPDRIHLVPAGEDEWTNPTHVLMTSDAIARLGFNDGGTWHITEMPGVLVRLMTNPTERALAAVYEHSQAGSWFDFVWRYEDGTSATWTTGRPTGLTNRPGHPTSHAPGEPPASLFERARRDRAGGPLKPPSATEAKQVFEDAYTESTAWRKAQGISRAEVVNLAVRKAA